MDWIQNLWVVPALAKAFVKTTAAVTLEHNAVLSNNFLYFKNKLLWQFLRRNVYITMNGCKVSHNNIM